MRTDFPIGSLPCQSSPNKSSAACGPRTGSLLLASTFLWVMNDPDATLIFLTTEYCGATPMICVLVLFLPATACARWEYSGETSLTEVISLESFIACASSLVSVVAPQAMPRIPPCVWAPGETVKRFEPNDFI